MTEADLLRDLVRWWLGDGGCLPEGEEMPEAPLRDELAALVRERDAAEIIQLVTHFVEQRRFREHHHDWEDFRHWLFELREGLI